MIIRIVMPAGNVVSMDMEEYLKGVVCVEMYTSWPMEALKAQAIAARTYAAWYVITNEGRGRWDCDTTTRYQAYVSWRNTRTNRAVDDTRGITGGTLDTALIRKTYFSSSCGGHTLNSWGPSWLRSTPCPCGRGVLGHRQGMCQYGAKYLAERGYTCFQILDFYYKLRWYGEYLQLGPVTYDPNPDNPWEGAPPPEPLPPFEEEPEPEPEPPPSIPPHYIGEGTFWREIENVLRWVAVKLGFLADAIKDVPIIGRLFFGTIDGLAITIDDLSLYVHEFEPQYAAVLRFIRDIRNLTLLNTLVSHLFQQWDSLRYDPARFVFYRVVAWWPGFYQLAVDPQGTVDQWLTERWPWIRSLRDSPRYWVFDRIVERWPDFYWLYQNPGYMIEFWITDRHPAFGAFLFDMEGWLRARIPDPLAQVQRWVIARMLHILQQVIETTWETGEAD